MTATLKLRDYQTKAIRAIHTMWEAGIWRPATVLPTGAGKTVVFSHLAEEYLTAHPTKRVLVLAHTDELVNQAAAKMRLVAPRRVVGIVKAAQNDVHAQVIVASVQSLRGDFRLGKIKNVGLIIVDECHHAVARTYQNVLRFFGALPDESGVFHVGNVAGVGSSTRPHCYVAGFTATLVRSDKAKLSDVWEDVAFRLSIAFMIRNGYLLDVKGKRVEVPDLDLGKVKTSGGDYQEGALGEALVEAMAPEIVAQAYLEHAQDRQGLVFAPTVDSAYAFADAFNEAGVKTEVVHGALGRDERRAILSRLADGTTQVVSNCMVLTEGFDSPKVSCAVIARPTKSAGLYQQMVGRVLRPDLTVSPEERGHALILDVVGISRRHDLRSLIDLSTREDLPEDVDEDLSLLELEELILDLPEEEELGAGGGREPDAMYYGPAETKDFDPLDRDSKRTWATTPGGHYYLAAGTAGYVFLVDSIAGDPGTYDVIWAAKEDRGPGSAGMTEHLGLDFQMAIAWAEEEATERGGYGTLTLTTKKAKWRKDPATSGQARKVRRAGVKVDQVGEEYVLPEEDGAVLTKGRASEIIEAAQAAGRIDPLVAAVRRALKDKGSAKKS